MESREVWHEREVEGAQRGESVRMGAVVPRGPVRVLVSMTVLRRWESVLMTVIASGSFRVAGRGVRALVVDDAVAQHAHTGLHNGAQRYRKECEKRYGLTSMGMAHTGASVISWSL